MINQSIDPDPEKKKSNQIDTSHKQENEQIKKPKCKKRFETAQNFAYVHHNRKIRCYQ
jgi:hypothetical protein